jgi:hypothetical protein
MLQDQRLQEPLQQGLSLGLLREDWQRPLPVLELLPKPVLQ